MRRAPSITERAIDRRSECKEGVVGGPGPIIGEGPRPGLVHCEPPAQRLVADGAAELHERAPKMGGLPEGHSKLARGAWSWLHAHLLLGGPGDGPWDYRFLEDDYRRLARRPPDIGTFWHRPPH
jgi:hypothetical protein